MDKKLFQCLTGHVYSWLAIDCILIVYSLFLTPLRMAVPSKSALYKDIRGYFGHIPCCISDQLYGYSAKFDLIFKLS